MESKQKLVVMQDDPEAATLLTGLSAWKSRLGNYFLTDQHDAEKLARWDGSTHHKCDCGEITERHWLKCRKCRDEADHETYLKMPKKKWNGEGGLVGFGDDHYFWSIEEAEDYAEDEGLTIADLDLVICEPEFADEIDPDDQFLDKLPEDQGLHEVYPELYKAIEEVNKLIRQKKQPLCWLPGKYRIDLD